MDATLKVSERHRRKPIVKSILVAVLALLLLGAAGNRAIQGQQVKTPPVYVISEANEITDMTV